MRLLERTLAEIKIAKRQSQTDSLGGVRETFSYDIVAKGSVSPVANTLNHAANALTGREEGMFPARTVRLLVAKDVDLEAGDGVKLWDEEWICEAVDTWSMHKEARLARREA